MPVSAILSGFYFYFILFFCHSSKTDFSGSTLMRPSRRLHGDSHKTVKFPLFQKSCGGCSPTVRDTFSNGTSFLSKGEPFIFGEFSQFASPFIKTHSLAVSKNANAPIVE